MNVEGEDEQIFKERLRANSWLDQVNTLNIELNEESENSQLISTEEIVDILRQNNFQVEQSKHL